MRKKILLITGINLYMNSSVCLANAAYIDGFLQNNCDVTVIMPDCDEADKDKSMTLPKKATYLVYDRTNSFERKVAEKVKTSAYSSENATYFSKFKSMVRRELSKLKQFYLKRTRKESLYKNSEYFIKEVVKNAADFCCSKYDYIISISSPVASHHLAEVIIKETNIKYSCWCQLWEDPWFYDLYTKKDQKIFDEEKRLLSLADIVEYVSPLTWNNQRKFFADDSNKMRWAYLPCYKTISYNLKNINSNCLKIGYFGEFVSTVRDIRPLAEAVSQTDGVKLLACGNTDLDMSKYSNVKSLGRISVDKVDYFQAESDLLVNISNLKGGQIPGKVYQYAGTNKPILFILDGSKEEQKLLLENFEKYNRFIFCENDVEQIRRCLQRIILNGFDTINQPVEDFSPFVIARKILEDLGNG